MAKASAIRAEGNNSFLFKGPFGFGKTLAAASFAIDGPVYLSYWDKKSPVELPMFFTKARFGDKAERILDNIEYDIYGAQNANDYLNKLIDMASGGCKYVAIINDSLTFMTTSAVGWSLNFGKSNTVHKNIKDVIPDWDEYKVETSLVAQCIEVSRKLPCHVIWTAHPLPGTKVEGGAGASMKVTKVNSLVSYGAKVAGIVPGAFTEIYHFSQRSNWDGNAGKSTKQYIVSTESIGDEFAKSPLLGDYAKEFDITDKLFYEVWRNLLKEKQGQTLAADKIEPAKLSNPFDQSNPSTEQPQQTKWRV